MTLLQPFLAIATVSTLILASLVHDHSDRDKMASSLRPVTGWAAHAE